MGIAIVTPKKLKGLFGFSERNFFVLSKIVTEVANLAVPISFFVTYVASVALWCSVGTTMANVFFLLVYYQYRTV
jgi:hypothetical protein